MKPKYLHDSLGLRNGSPRGERSRGGGLKGPWDLLKWNISVLECSIMRPKLSKSLERML